MRGMRMIRQSLVAAAGLMILGGATASAVRAQTVTPCPDANNCAQVKVENVSGAPGGTVSVPLTFKQGPASAAAGGIDEIAAIALTLNIGSSLTLGSACALGTDGLPVAVVPDAAISNFKVVVENASCAGGRTHCLCPDAGSGIVADPFINLVIYGPNPLPAPGPSPIDIPVLPTGPLLSIGLQIALGASGTLPLHVFTESAPPAKPQFTAYLSVGDKTAVDQTCVPVSGQPPCSGAPTPSVSQVLITDGSVTVTGIPCLGDCNRDHEVTVDELLKMVNIALGTLQLTECPAGDGDASGDITIDEIIKAVSNALNGCP